MKKKSAMQIVDRLDLVVDDDANCAHVEQRMPRYVTLLGNTRVCALGFLENMRTRHALPLLRQRLVVFRKSLLGYRCAGPPRESQIRRVNDILEFVDHRKKLGRVDLVERVLAVPLRVGLDHEASLNVVSASRYACDRRCVHHDLTK